jgi:hypothetical protein
MGNFKGYMIVIALIGALLGIVGVAGAKGQYQPGPAMIQFDRAADASPDVSLLVVGAPWYQELTVKDDNGFVVIDWAHKPLGWQPHYIGRASFACWWIRGGVGYPYGSIWECGSHFGAHGPNGDTFLITDRMLDYLHDHGGILAQVASY